MTFSATRWVGQSLTLTSFLENLPGLRRVLLANSHDANGFSVPPAVATDINDGAIENTLRSLSPCLRLLFRVSASLESDGSPLSAVLGLYSGFSIVLRGETFALPAATRSFLSGLLVSRFSAYSHPLLVLAFYLDPFFVPCRQRVGTGLWGAASLPALRTRAVQFLGGGEEALEMAVTRELGAFLRFVDAGVALTPAAQLHPATWWSVYGDEWPTLQWVAVRLLALPCSSAGSERAFKPLGRLLSRTRNRTMDPRVEKQWTIFVNSRQLRRSDPVSAYARSGTERHVLDLVLGRNAAPMGGAGGAPGGGRADDGGLPGGGVLNDDAYGLRADGVADAGGTAGGGGAGGSRQGSGDTATAGGIPGGPAGADGLPAGGEAGAGGVPGAGAAAWHGGGQDVAAPPPEVGAAGLEVDGTGAAAGTADGSESESETGDDGCDSDSDVEGISDLVASPFSELPSSAGTAGAGRLMARAPPDGLALRQVADNSSRWAG